MSEEECSEQKVKVNIFEKLDLLFYFQPSRFPVCILYRHKHCRMLISKALSEDFHRLLIDRIEQLQKKGYQVLIERLRTEIPDEYIGVETLYHGAKLISRTYLKQQVSSVERKQTVFELISCPYDNNQIPIH